MSGWGSRLLPPPELRWGRCRSTRGGACGRGSTAMMAEGQPRPDRWGQQPQQPQQLVSSGLCSAEGLQGQRGQLPVRLMTPSRGSPPQLTFRVTECCPRRSSLKTTRLPDKERASQNHRGKTSNNPIPRAPPCLPCLRARRPRSSQAEVSPLDFQLTMETGPAKTNAGPDSAAAGAMAKALSYGDPRSASSAPGGQCIQCFQMPLKCLSHRNAFHKTARWQSYC